MTDNNLAFSYNFNDITKTSFSAGYSIFGNSTYGTIISSSPSISSSMTQNFAAITYKTDTQITDTITVNSIINNLHIGLNPISGTHTISKDTNPYCIIITGLSVDNVTPIYIIIPFKVGITGNNLDLDNLLLKAYNQLNGVTPDNRPMSLNNLILQNILYKLSNHELTSANLDEKTIVIVCSPLIALSTSGMIPAITNGKLNLTNSTIGEKTTNFFSTSNILASSKFPTHNSTMAINSTIYIDCQPVNITPNKKDNVTFTMSSSDMFKIGGEYSTLINTFIVIFIIIISFVVIFWGITSINNNYNPTVAA